MSIISKDIMFCGYQRENGRVDVRNRVIILPIDDLSNATSEEVAHNVKGTMVIPHPHGRLQFGTDLDLHLATLIGAGCNPNVAAVVVIGIEESWTKKVVDGIARTGKPVVGFGIEGRGDHETMMKASKAAKEYVQLATEQLRVEWQRRSTTRRSMLAAAASSAAVAMMPVLALAQTDYPAKPVRYIVPFAAGGLTDVMARLVGQKVSEALGQPVVIDNKPGASANLGAEVAAKAPADGYTWLAITLTHAVNQSLFSNLPYNLVKDFAPVAHLATSPLALVVNAANPAKSLQQFLASAKGKSLNGGSSGNGTPPHLGLALLALNAKIDVQHVPYKGGAPSINDLLGNQIDFIVSNLPESAPYIKSGKLKALAVTSSRRHALLPDVPTFSEAGLRGMTLENWTGLVVPSGTPPAIVEKIAADAIHAVKLPDVAARLESMGFTPTGLGPAQFATVIHQDVERWHEIVKTQNIKAD